MLGGLVPCEAESWEICWWSRFSFYSIEEAFCAHGLCVLTDRFFVCTMSVVFDSFSFSDVVIPGDNLSRQLLRMETQAAHPLQTYCAVPSVPSHTKTEREGISVTLAMGRIDFFIFFLVHLSLVCLNFAM